MERLRCGLPGGIPGWDAAGKEDVSVAEKKVLQSRQRGCGEDLHPRFHFRRKDREKMERRKLIMEQIQEMSWEEAKGEIVFWLVNRKRNKMLLKTTRVLNCGDMALVCGLHWKEGNERRFVLITQEQMSWWRVPIREMLAEAEQNMIQRFPAVKRPLEEVLQEAAKMVGQTWEKEGTGLGRKLILLTNREGYLGASAMLYDGVLKELADAMGSDLFILPSSIHEVLALPDDGEVDWKELEEIVQTINQTEVEDREVLSDTVYCYCRENDLLLPARAFSSKATL